MRAEETQVVNVRLSLSEIRALDEQAGRDNRTRSGYIRKIIASALDAPRDTTQQPHSEATR